MEIRKCSQCGKEFTLTDGEIAFYKSKNLHLPKRCKDCCNKNKINKSDSVSKSNSVSIYYGASKPTAKNKQASNISLTRILAIFIAIVIGLFAFLYTYSSLNLNTSDSANTSALSQQSQTYSFRNYERYTEHYNKHGKEVGATSKEDYLRKANAVINNPNALQKTEAEDGDKVFFLADTGEIVFLSTDGYIRTYFIADYAYFLRT